ncbi:MAG: hypothetical protein WC344_03690 [Bacilli bacterium]|jgi:hypothetical protein
MNERLKRTGLFLGIAVLGGTFAVSLASGVAIRNSSFETKAVPTSTYSLVGSMQTPDQWALEDHTYELVKVGESTLYRWTGALPTDTEFKLNTNDTWPGVIGFSGLTSVLKGTVLSSPSGDNIKVTYSSGTPTFEVLFDTSGSLFRIQYSSTFAEPLSGGITSSRMRVFLNRGNAYVKDGAINCLQFGSSIEWNTTIHKPTGYANTGMKFIPNGGTLEEDLFLAYFDLNIADLANGYKLRVVRTNGGDNAYVHIWDITSEMTWATGNNNLVLYVGDDWSHTLSAGIIADTASIPLGYGEGEAWQSYGFIEKVLEGYLTCSSSNINGWGAFAQMELTFFKKADKTTWKILGDLSTISLTDYSGTGDSGYGEVRGGGTAVTGWYKYARLSTLYAAANPSGSIIDLDFLGNNGNGIMIIIIIALVGLTSLAGLYILRKKRA